MNEAKIDRRYHYLGGLLFALIFFIIFNYIFDYKILFKGSIVALFSATTTISSIGVGFLATTKAILVSMRSTKIINWLKSGGHYTTLIDYSMNAIHWCFAVAIYSAICLFLNYDDPEYIHFITIVFWIFCSTTAFLSSYRVIRLFSTILKDESKSPST